MDRRSFLASITAAGGTLLLRRFASAEGLPPASRPISPIEQSVAIRTSATWLLQTLAPERRDRITFAFPKGQTPTAIGFSHLPGRPGGPGDPHRSQHGVAFDINGHPKPDEGPMGGHGPGGTPPGAPGKGFGFGPPGGPHGGPLAAGEKYGQAVWTNFPVSNVPRPGLQMGQFTAVERAAVHGLLQTVLSPMGYQKVLDIMTADQVVADAGADYAAGLDVYTLALFGLPSATAPWMLQFGGHHLGLNVTFVGDKAVCAPLHTGILPARFEANGRIVRGLGRENDKAFDLLATFTPEQLKAAMIQHDVSDLIFGPGHPNSMLSPQGLRGADMTEHQLTMMLSLIGEWTGVLNNAHAGARLEEIRRSLADTRFAWSGSTTHQPGYNGEAYFRIQGPSVVIEHAPQGNQGGYQVHVHTIMRDLNNDYGKQLVGA
jgi:hypothetical protein